MNIVRPPFRVDSAQTAEEAGVEIVQAFLAIENLPEKVSRVFAALLSCLNAAPDDSLAVAGHRLAWTIDHDDPHLDLPYHNRQHVCEVMLCCHYLARRLNLDQRETLEILLASLFHDFRHDGTSNGGLPFRLERNSVVLAEPYLLGAGVTSAQRRKLAALVLATNPNIGLPIAHASYDHHHHRAPLPEIPVTAPELNALRSRPAADQALILCAADILPSIGLTIAYAQALQEKLAKEWGTDLGIEDKLRFIDNTLPIFAICDFFAPNILRLKAYLMDQLETQHDARKTG
ncbi:hypothetical protein [Methylomicrobium lacus]|uniref:hypothetical protein n=1 Tax=Methylomicrobium lacus TaxID=136992 RepID=UPI0035A8422E